MLVSFALLALLLSPASVPESVPEPPSDSAPTAHGEPVADEPVAEEPVAVEPVADEPVADELVELVEPVADEPEPAVLTVVAPIESEPALPAVVAPTEPEPETPNRRGLLLGASLGYVGCGTRVCRFSGSEASWRYRGGGMARVELGPRSQRVAPVLSAGLGGGPVDHMGELAGSSGVMRFLELGVGMLVLPLVRSRFDPYVGAHFGYARAVDHFRSGQSDYESRVVFSRIGARLTAGLSYYVLPTVSMGPRFDLTMPVSGRICITQTEGREEERECTDVADLPGGVKPFLPRWWTVTFDLRVVLPRGKAR